MWAMPFCNKLQLFSQDSPNWVGDIVELFALGVEAYSNTVDAGIESGVVLPENVMATADRVVSFMNRPENRVIQQLMQAEEREEFDQALEAYEGTPATGRQAESGMHAGMAMLINHCVKNMAVEHIANECFLGFLWSVEARECVQVMGGMRLIAYA